MKKLLVTGGRGFVAGSVIAQSVNTREVHALSRGGGDLPCTVHQVDLVDADAVGKVLAALQPDAVIHTAAIANIDYCQAHPDEARAVNTEATRIVAQACAAVGAKLVHCSTDTIYDGARGSYTEEDAPGPVNVYAETKVAAEEAAMEAGGDWVIGRVSVVYGLPLIGAGNSFLARVIAAMEAGETYGAPSDEIRTPIDVITLGQALLELAGNDYTGYLQLGGNDRLNRYEMVCRIARSLGFPEELVEAKIIADLALRAARPVDVSLDNSRARSVLNTPFCGLEEGIVRIVAYRDGAGL